MAKHQVKVLAAPAAFDVEEFYATRTMMEVTAGAALVISADGKGILEHTKRCIPEESSTKSNTTNLQSSTLFSTGPSSLFSTIVIRNDQLTVLVDAPNIRPEMPQVVGISVDNNEISALAGLDRTQLVFQAHEF